LSDSAPAFDLVTIGRSSIDLYANDEGVPFVAIKSFAAYVGGCPTNVAVGAQRLGLSTALLTAVGQDPVGDFILKFLRDEGVETRFIPRKSGARSSAVLLGIEPPDRFPLVFYREGAADLQLTIDDVAAAPLADCRAFLLSGTGLSREPSRSATLFATERARAAGATVFLDLDFRADQWDDPRAYGVAIRALLPLAQVVLGTEAEVKATMLDHAGQVSIPDSQVSAPVVDGDLEAAVETILARGPDLLAVKRGARGATLFLEDKGPLDVPGFPVQVRNALGAGDAFASGLIYGALQGWDWSKAARMGNACGAWIVTQHGCANFMATRSEILSFIEQKGGF
jgi:5-dehydro-2-deoxygluconokinase